MTVLHMGTLEDLNDCYHFEHSKAPIFLEKGLLARLAKFKSIYSQPLYTILESMVELNGSLRQHLFEIYLNV